VSVGNALGYTRVVLHIDQTYHAWFFTPDDDPDGDRIVEGETVVIRGEGQPPVEMRVDPKIAELGRKATQVIGKLL
jgi:hypothetical protein